MTTTLDPEAVAVLELGHGDTIHLQPHEVFRHDPGCAPHLVACAEADVTVDVLIVVHHIIVICWRGCPGVCGAVVYDDDDSVMRLGTVAA